MCMVLDICGGEASKLSFAGKLKKNNKIIDLNYEKFLNIIGFSITSSEIKKILSSLGCEIKSRKKKY